MKHSMSRLALLIVASFLFSNIILNAQEKEKMDGKYAFQFQIGSNFTLRSFQGSVFSGKYNLSENDAFRLGISINASKQDANNNNQNIVPQFNNTTINHGETNSYGIVFQYIRNNYLENNLNFYFGGGPGLTYNINRSENYSTPGQNSTSVNDYQRYYGITALAGIEWYFSKTMSLSAEYGITYNYLVSTQDRNQVSNNIQQNYSETKTYGFQMKPSGVLFGLTVYF